MALASEADDWRDRELGPIHLLKYAYLADLAFAEQGDGTTYTRTPWRFYNLGPWCEDAFARIDTAASAVDAQRRSFVGDRGQTVRYKVESGNLERVASSLPGVVLSALRHSIREFGNDTNDLLNHVYTTAPMLKAAPGEPLVFAAKPEPEPIEAPTDDLSALSAKARRARRDKLAALRQEMKQRLSTPRRGRVPMPTPRYDEVFEKGAAWLDTLAGDPVPTGVFDAAIGEDVWKSASRAGHAD